MLSPIKLSFVRIMRNGKVLGNGFLGPGKLVVTCAHVIAAAYDRRAESAPPESTPGLEVCFHWVDGKPIIPVCLAEGGWRYVQGEVDISVLKLDAEAPSGARPLNLAEALKERFAAELEPYIPSLQVSRRIEAKVDGRDENGRLVIVPTEPSRQWIESGVSGAPVFVSGGELVEGIVMQDDTMVQQAFLVPAYQIRTLMDVIAAQPSLSERDPWVKAADGAAISASAGSLATLDEGIIEAFLGTDPIVGEDAIERLALAGPASLRVLLTRTKSTPQQVLRLRKLCERIGAGALDPLIDAIRDGDWNLKLSAAPCFAALGDRVKAEARRAIYDLLKLADFDIRRLAIVAAGYLGYSSDIRWELARLAKYNDLNGEWAFGGHISYSFGKLYTYVLEALGRGFARNGEISELNHIREFFDLCVEGQISYAERRIAAGFEDLTPKAADQLIADWLPRSEGPWSRLALDALAQLRLRRAVEAVATRLHDRRPDVRAAAGICLGNTGDDAAAHSVCRALVNGAPSDGALWAVSMLCRRNVEWPAPEQFVEIARGDSAISGQMMVSLALRKHPAAVELARCGLSHQDSFLRGASAIALAYAQPQNAAIHLSGLADEAASDGERVLVAAGEVLAGCQGRSQALHEALRQLTSWPTVLPFWRYHILAALGLPGNDRRRAKLWAEVSRDNAPRIEALVTELIGYVTAQLRST